MHGRTSFRWSARGSKLAYLREKCFGERQRERAGKRQWGCRQRRQGKERKVDTKKWMDQLHMLHLKPSTLEMVVAKGKWGKEGRYVTDLGWWLCHDWSQGHQQLRARNRKGWEEQQMGHLLEEGKRAKLRKLLPVLFQLKCRTTKSALGVSVLSNCSTPEWFRNTKRIFFFMPTPIKIK